MHSRDFDEGAMAAPDQAQEEEEEEATEAEEAYFLCLVKLHVAVVVEEEVKAGEEGEELKRH